MISKVLSCITKQIKQKKKLLLKSLFVLLLWFSFLPQQNYFSFNEAYADTNNEQQVQKEKLVSIDTFMEAFSKVAFVLLWPLVALAWLAMDNSLIYWSFMWLDVTLWNLWQIVRSFANYILWFLFLYCILYYNFSWKTWLKNIKLSDFLRKTLIASVLIQASWFIMMALVDLSTILTYSIWWLPYSIMGEEASWWSGDYRMFKMNVDVNLWNYDAKVENNWDLSNAVIYYWHATWTKYIAPCDTIQKKFWDESQSFIIWRKFESFSWNKMMPWYCMYYWDLVSFADFLESETSWYQEKHNELKQFISQKDVGEIEKLVNAGFIYPISIGSWLVKRVETKSSYNWTFEAGTKNPDPKVPCDIDSKAHIWIVPSKKGKTDWECLYKETDISIWNILKKSSSMTGPFAALYSSFSVYSHLDVEGLWLWQKFVVMFVNICFAIMLILPLIALVLVLFARIWLLWIAIALSPFLVLVKVFDDVFSLPEDLKKYLSFEQLKNLLLAPVFISFAIWIALVFMSTLKSNIWTGVPNVEIEGDKKEEFYTKLNKISWMNASEDGIDMLWFIKIKLDSALLNFSWLLTMFFWLWLTWFLLFFAIKYTKIWESIWGSLENLWKWMFLSTPIIPVGKNWLWLWAIMDAPERFARWYSDKLEKRSAQWLDSVLKRWENRDQLNNFYKENQSFHDAFWLTDADYKNTSWMLGKMDVLIGYSGADWKDRAEGIWVAYNDILKWAKWAKSKEVFESIITSMNNNRVSSNEVARGMIKDENLTYTTEDGKQYWVKHENWRYEVVDLNLQK